MSPNTTRNPTTKRPPSFPAHRISDPGLNFGPPPIQTSVAPVRIVGSRKRYRGGYHLNV
jgi:hypothetical protein